jgi:hypothetical protein
VVSTLHPDWIYMNRVRIMIWWIVMWITNRRIAKIATSVDISRTGIVSKPKVKSRLVVPGIIGVKVNKRWMIDRRDIYMPTDDYWSALVFFYCFFICLRIFAVFFVNLLLGDITQLRITTG